MQLFLSLKLYDVTKSNKYIIYANQINYVESKNFISGFELDLECYCYKDNINELFINFINSKNIIQAELEVKSHNSDDIVFYNGILDAKSLTGHSEHYYRYKFKIIDLAKGVFSKQHKLDVFKNKSLQEVINNNIPDLLIININTQKLNVKHDLINLNCYKINSFDNSFKTTFSFYDFIIFICDKYNLFFIYNYKSGQYYISDSIDVLGINNKALNINFVENIKNYNYNHAVCNEGYNKIINIDSFVINEYLEYGNKDSNNLSNNQEINYLSKDKDYQEYKNKDKLHHKFHIDILDFNLNKSIKSYDTCEINYEFNNVQNELKNLDLLNYVEFDFLNNEINNVAPMISFYSELKFLNKSFSSVYNYENNLLRSFDVKANIKYIEYLDNINYIFLPQYNNSEYFINMPGVIVYDDSDEANDSGLKTYNLVEKEDGLYCFVKLFYNNQIVTAKYSPNNNSGQVFIPPVNGQKVDLKLDLFNININKFIDWRLVNHSDKVDKNNSENLIDLGFSNHSFANIKSKLENESSKLTLNQGSEKMGNKICLSDKGLEISLEYEE